MATERRYLSGDTVKVVEHPNPERIGAKYTVGEQYRHNGVVRSRLDMADGDWMPFYPHKYYANQVELVKRPWWNWLLVPFAGRVVKYARFGDGL